MDTSVLHLPGPGDYPVWTRLRAAAGHSSAADLRRGEREYQHTGRRCVILSRGSGPGTGTAEHLREKMLARLPSIGGVT
jgi:hypothetical protein